MMIPIVILINSRTMAIGNMMMVAARNIDPAAAMPASISIPGAIGAPIGRIR